MPANTHILSERTPRLFPNWRVREYDNGTYDAYNVDGTALSPGCDTYEAAYEWLLNEIVHEGLI